MTAYHVDRRKLSQLRICLIHAKEKLPVRPLKLDRAHVLQPDEKKLSSSVLNSAQLRFSCEGPQTTQRVTKSFCKN